MIDFQHIIKKFNKYLVIREIFRIFGNIKPIERIYYKFY